MRRRPTENNGPSDTQVFSSSSWGNAEMSYATPDNRVDISKYAAPAIPEGNTRSARSARHSPSPHSSYYEPSENATNSDHDPFSHSLYDGRPAPVPQNSKFEDMPSPVRKSRLGGPIQGIAPEPQSTNVASVANATTTIAAPTTAPAPAMYVPVKPEIPKAPPATQISTAPPASAPISAPPQQAYEPIAAPQDQVPIATPSEVEKEIPLSDFEEEFLQEKEEVQHEEPIVDIREDLPQQNQAWAAPSLFTTPLALTTPEISYHTSDDFFGTQYGDETDADRLYKDPREPRETIQIDKDFLIRQYQKLTLNKIVAIVIVIILLITAYFVMKPSTTASQNSPVNESQLVDSPTGKTVVDDTTVSEPSVTLAPANSQVNPESPDSGPIIEYDEQGNAIYSDSTN